MDTVAELDQLTLAETITALRGLCDDTRTRKENAELITTVANIADGLASIQGSIEGIRYLLAGLDIKSEDGDDEGTAVARCGTKFRTGLDICLSTSDALIERLDVVVVMSEPEDDCGYESDWGSLAESVKDVKSTLGDQLAARDDILKHAVGLMEPLCKAWEIIHETLENQPTKVLSDPPDVINTSAARDVFRRLEKISSSLKFPDSEGRRQPWTTFLKPLRLKGFFGRVNSNVETQLNTPRPSLSRTRTWPMQLKGPVDPEAEEARKRSAQIDKQLQADSSVQRNRCSVVLQGLGVSRESKALLADTFASLSTSSGIREKLDSPGIDPRPMIMQRLHDEVEKMVMLAQHMLNPSVEESVYIRALGEKMEDGKLQALDRDVSRLLGSLWSLDGCRTASLEAGRPPAWDRIILDAVSRAVLPNYLSTPQDYRRFVTFKPFATVLGPFRFSFDPISIDIIDPHWMGRKQYRALLHDATNFLWTIDLAHYDDQTGEPDGHTYFGHILALLSASRGRETKSRASLIIIFHNVKEFRAKLKHTPFASIYRDFRGRENPREIIYWMLKKILGACSDKERIYPHVGELSSRSTVRFIIAAIKESLLHRALMESGLF